MRVVLVATALMLILAAPAVAQITAFWEQATITPQAIANDPQLASMQSWDLMTTTTGNWLSAGMWAQLPPGRTYYKHPLGGLTRPDPALFGSSPALEFTTYASAATDNGANHTTLILGGYIFLQPSIGDPTSPQPGVFDVLWGNASPTAPPGTYQIARLTFLRGVLPDVLFSSITVQINPEVSTQIPQIPEPSTMSLVVALLWRISTGSRRTSVSHSAVVMHSRCSRWAAAKCA